MKERCEACGHEKSMGRCWRLTCITNGARLETMQMARPADDVSLAGTLFDQVKAESAERGRRVLAGFAPLDPDKWDHHP